MKRTVRCEVMAWDISEVVQLDLALLLAGTRYRGDFEDCSNCQRIILESFHVQISPN